MLQFCLVFFEVGCEFWDYEWNTKYSRLDIDMTGVDTTDSLIAARCFSSTMSYEEISRAFTQQQQIMIAISCLIFHQFLHVDYT
jgi:hypothetical protein